MRINFELEDLEQYAITYLSLGAGVQSSCLFYMACIGDPIMPKIDFAVFSDTGDEPQYVYKQLEYLQNLGKKYNIPVFIVSKNDKPMSYDIFNPGVNRFASVPGFTKNPDGSIGMLRRQCTGEYKIQPIVKFLKRHMGFKKGMRIMNKGIPIVRVLSIQGISLDEIQRMKEPLDKWQDVGYPLVHARMNRQACHKWIDNSEFQQVEKSACVYCPFHGNNEWKAVKECKEDWELALRVDEAIRDSSKKGASNPIYLHRSCKPLKDIDFDDHMDDLFDNECDGICGL